MIVLFTVAATLMGAVPAGATFPDSGGVMYVAQGMSTWGQESSFELPWSDGQHCGDVSGEGLNLSRTPVYWHHEMVGHVGLNSAYLDLCGYSPNASCSELNYTGIDTGFGQLTMLKRDVLTGTTSSETVAVSNVVLHQGSHLDPYAHYILTGDTSDGQTLSAFVQANGQAGGRCVDEGSRTGYTVHGAFSLTPAA